MLFRINCIVFFIVLLGYLSSASYAGRREGWQRTILDDYVLAPDDSFSYELKHTFTQPGFYTGYSFTMTSQTWLPGPAADPDAGALPSVWKHHVVICVPDVVETNTASLYIGQGDNEEFEENVPTDMSKSVVTEALCIGTQSVAVHLRQVPNQPIIMDSDGVPRVEDGFVAWTWMKFLNDTQKNGAYLARLPMTKAVFKAMDMVEEFTRTLDNCINVRKFILAGASKRGWTAWSTAVVDAISYRRVSAIVPIVIPILNLRENADAQFQNYGAWTFAFNDYVSQGFTAQLATPELLIFSFQKYKELLRIIDPYSYRVRLRLPKLIISTTGDEFFVPESANLFFDDLVGNKNYMTMIPNAGHNFDAYPGLESAIQTTTTFFNTIARHSAYRLPRVTWELEKGETTGSITVRNRGYGSRPTSVKVWSATTISSTARDFRMFTCPLIQCYNAPVWTATELEETSRNTWTVSFDAPAQGWTGFYVDVEFDQTISWGCETQPLTISTEFNVVPDVRPFDNCEPDNC